MSSISNKGVKLLQKRLFQGFVNKSILQETTVVILPPSLSSDVVSCPELMVSKKVQRNWKELNKVQLRAAKMVRAEVRLMEIQNHGMV